ncbi:Ig-like domain-containing protein [Arenibacter palladensis]|uniref:Ig-like domain-containing protein n=1 Tax=Arenibacter palladensis TaxID=237373 RepID=UPI002FCEE734
MKFHPSNFFQLTLASIVLFLSFSCNKDSDLLAEYVVEKPQSFLANDVVATLSNNPIIIKPLSNDTFENPEEVIITEVTPPKMGTAEVQEDNTVVYTPNPDETGTDEFDYTTSVTNPDNSVSTATGSISVTVTETAKTPTDPNAVNFSKYGAVGDGKADDTKAIQAALDAEESLIANEGAAFRITGTINIDKSGNQTIDFNGATITATSTLDQAFKINKSNGLTTIIDLTINGDRKIQSAFYVQSRITATNVNVNELYANGTRAVAWRVEVSSASNSQGEYNFNDCDCTDVESQKNNVIGDMIGVSRCLWLRWLDTNSNTTVNVNGGVWDGAWGDDGDLIQVEQTTNDYIHDCKLIVTDTELKNFSRRAVKGTASNTEFHNVTFTSPYPSNPRLTSTVPSSGMATMATFNITSYPNSISRNHVFNGCTFNNPGGYEGRIIPSRAELVTIKNCTFNTGTSLALNIRVGDIKVCGNTFVAGSTIYDYGSGGVDYVGEISIGTNNIAQEGFNKLAASVWSTTGACQ